MLSVNVVKRKIGRPKILFSSILCSDSGCSPEIGRSGVAGMRK